ncbi:MAG: hypothetical protein EXR59_02060 [Dehalococcoidia bacterium]|nr:hypothetical protein [Dehalococcoidia bacterium]
MAVPVCGSIMQDMDGTAQRIWAGDGYKDQSDISKQLALVHDNNEPSFAMLATGGGPIGISYLPFTPETEGFIDRDFAAIVYRRDDVNSVYCYDLLPAVDPGGRIIIQMTSAIPLKAEFQSNSCFAGA